MTDTERLIYKDRVQSLALSLLRNATVQADLAANGVELWIEFSLLGNALLTVPWEIDKRNIKLSAWLKIELGYLMQDLCRQRYFR